MRGTTLWARMMTGRTPPLPSDATRSGAGPWRWNCAANSTGACWPARRSPAFGIEPWYAQRRAKRVLSRASRQEAEISPFIGGFSEMEEDMSPLQYACSLLGPRVRPLRNGYYILDGFQAGPKEVTRAANRLLRERGQAEIPYPGLTPLYR